MDITTVNAWLGVLTFLILLIKGFLFLAWRSIKADFVTTAKFDAAMELLRSNEAKMFKDLQEREALRDERLSDGMCHLSGLVGKLEGALEQLPTRHESQEMRVGLANLGGDYKAVVARIDGMETQLERMDRHLSMMVEGHLET